MKSTIRDVATLAGVSVTTAHRALSGKAELSAGKRSRVLDAARQLEYVPSATARALVTGKTKTIGMIVTDNASPVYAGIVRGVEEIANEAGYGLLLCNSADDQERALVCIDLFSSLQVDGIVITPVQTDQRDIERLTTMGMPFVMLLRDTLVLIADAVVIDNEQAGFEATSHLLDQGHTRIAHIGGPEWVSSARGRLAGFQQAMGHRGVRINTLFVERAPFTVAGGYRAALNLLGGETLPTAIFAANDLQAVGVMKAAREIGVRIPEELALVGGDDIELAEFLLTPLTTFHQPAREIGSLGAETLLGRLHGEAGPPSRLVLKPMLIVRESSGGPV